MALHRLAGIRIDIQEFGHGPPLLFLHGGGGFRGDERFLGPLSRGRRVVAPSHPGFGASELPDWMDRPLDIAFVYLDLLDSIGHAEVDVVGCSFGGWIAAELATMAPHRLRTLTLVGPLGIVDGDVPDMFALPPERVEAMLWANPEKFRRDPATLPEEEAKTAERNRQSFARFARTPYFANPKLAHRLRRATCPALILRGLHDGLIPAAYAERFAALLPDARLASVPGAGHLPQIEQPEIFCEYVLSFLRGDV
mgnify:CR=1 FL=1|jgi:pimeloyl-ACP methyl ester carboxylesterase